MEAPRPKGLGLVLCLLLFAFRFLLFWMVLFVSLCFVSQMDGALLVAKFWAHQTVMYY
jgi:hypothetical protein